MPEQKVRLSVGWVESTLLGWVSYLNPTYKNMALYSLSQMN